jgi:uncharacterized protein YgiM (DUF1202 family)
LEAIYKMNYRMKRIASCLLAGAIVISGTGVGTYGAQTGGVSAVIATGLSSNGSPAAGFSKMLSQCLIESDKAVAEAAAQAEEQVSENDVPVVASEYADIAIAQVDNYVNVRSEPNTDSEVLGKLYNNSAATVLETTEDGWYKITSGSVTGYVKCEYVVTGDEELAKKVSTRYATVTTTTLYVRMEPSTEAGILTMLGEGDDFVVVDDSMKDSGWVIVTTEEGDGYVSTDYVNLWTDFVTAESKAEEEARLAKEEAERQPLQQRRQNRNLPRTRHLRTVQAVPAVHQLLMRHRVDPMVRQLQAMQANLLVTHMFMVVPV